MKIKKSQKIFVLDTNILLHDPTSIFKFENNIVVIPMIVLEELDNFKKGQDETGRNSRQVSRILDQLRAKGDLAKGVDLENNGYIRVDITAQVEGTPVENMFVANKADYKILATAYNESQKNKNNKVILVSKDINLRIKADILGILAEDYNHDKIKFDEMYSGLTEKVVSADIINQIYSNNESYIGDMEWSQELYANQYVILKNELNPQHTGIARYNSKGKKLVNLNSQINKGIWGIHPKNLEQRIALDLLLNDEIKLVSLVGKAGTGKTLISIAAGLCKSLDEQVYKKLLVSRPVFPLGKDIGFLPGDINEKLDPWMKPIFDNIDFLFHGNKKEEKFGYKASSKDILEQDLVAVEPLTYIRGRSIPNQYIIIDESQNLTPHEIKTIITRAGDNTKIVLTGDCYQIDNPYVDSGSNGLAYVVDRMKDVDIAGNIILTKGERSQLAEVASNVL